MNPADIPCAVDDALRYDLAEPLTVIRCRTNLARRRLAVLPLSPADRADLDRQLAAIDAAAIDVVRRLDGSSERSGGA